MTLVCLAGLSQVADGLGYYLAAQHGLTSREINPLAVAIGDPVTQLALKVGAGLVMALGSVVLIRAGRSRAVAWLSVIGFVGALSETAAL